MLCLPQRMRDARLPGAEGVRDAVSDSTRPECGCGVRLVLARGRSQEGPRRGRPVAAKQHESPPCLLGAGYGVQGAGQRCRRSNPQPGGALSGELHAIPSQGIRIPTRTQIPISQTAPQPALQRLPQPLRTSPRPRPCPALNLPPLRPMAHSGTGSLGGATTCAGSSAAGAA